jgi:oligoribonuclease NrnB/cAMP/cGMP phosphodiesterase (DHH superfamily)
MGEIICYHHNDLDGRSSAALVRHFIYKQHNYMMNPEDFIECDHVGVINTEIAKDKIVFIVDYSFGDNELSYLEEICKNAKHVIWIDHHKTAIEMSEKYPWMKELHGIRDTSMSACPLVFRYFTGKKNLTEMPKWVQYVSDYDTWTKALESSTDFKLGMDLRDQSHCALIWDNLIGGEGFENKILMLGQVIHDGSKVSIYNSKRYDRMVSSIYEKDIHLDTEYKAIILNCTDHTSEVFKDKINDYDIGIVWHRQRDKYLFSIYSTKENVDCAKICQEFGGGGHKGAAGFSCKFFPIQFE